MVIAMAAGERLAFILSVVCGLLLALALAVPALRRRGYLPAVIFSLAAAFGIFAAKCYLEIRPLEPLIGQRITASFHLLECQEEGEYAAFYTAEVLECPPLEPGTRVTLLLDHPGRYQRYLNISGDFDIDWDEYLPNRARGIYLVFSDNTEPEITGFGGRPWNAAFADWRDQALAAVDRHADGDEAALMKGIGFGARKVLSRQAESWFRDIGLSHLMSVSGFHMSLLTAGLLRLLRLLRTRQSKPRRYIQLLAIPLAAGFTLLTGMAFSTVRAAIMCAVVLTAAAVRREPDLRSALGFAVIAMLLIQPFSVYDVGFLMSVTSMWGIAVLWPVLRRKPAQRAVEKEPLRRRILQKAASWAANGAALTLSATLPTIPVAVLYFGRISTVSIIANLAADMAASLVLFAAVIGAPLAGFIPWAAEAVFAVGRLTARYLLWMAETLAALPWSAVTVNLPHVTLWLCLTPALLWAAYKLRGNPGVRLTAAFAVPVLLISILIHTAGMRGVTTVTAPAGPEKDAVLLIERDGRAGLVVLGRRGNLNNTRYLLAQKGIRRLDFVLYPSWENKRLAGLKNIHEDFPVTTLICPDIPPKQTIVADVLAIEDRQRLSFWEGDLIRRYGNWYQLLLGETRLLIAPAEGDAGELPPDWLSPDLIVFTGTPPKKSDLFTAKAGLVICDADHLRVLTRVLPWGSYPIADTAQNDFVVITRGKKDLSF